MHMKYSSEREAVAALLGPQVYTCTDTYHIVYVFMVSTCTTSTRVEMINGY